MRTTWRKSRPKSNEKTFRINHQIKAPEVFLIGDGGEQIGKIPLSKALAMASESGLDLLEVNPKAVPPIVKIIDFGQFKYEREKQAHKQKVQQKKVEIKGIRLSVRISEHDFDFRINQAKKFLEKGNKLKLELVLKGREKQHPDKAYETINKFIEALNKVEGITISREQDLTKQGGRFTIILINKK